MSLVSTCIECFAAKWVMFYSRPNGTYVCRHRMTATEATEASEPSRQTATEAGDGIKAATNPVFDVLYKLAAAERDRAIVDRDLLGRVVTEQAAAIVSLRRDLSVAEQHAAGLTEQLKRVEVERDLLDRENSVLQLENLKGQSVLTDVSKLNDSLRDEIDACRSERNQEKRQNAERLNQNIRLVNTNADLRQEIRRLASITSAAVDWVRTLHLTDAEMSIPLGEVATARLREITRTPHTCPAPAANPTRGEAIEALLKISIVINGVGFVQRNPLFRIAQIDRIVNSVLPESERGE